jgi:hypothetical protein
MALGRFYTNESFFRIVDVLGEGGNTHFSKDQSAKDDDIRFLESSAPVVGALKDYELVVSCILKILKRDLNQYHPEAKANMELAERICKIFHPVFVNTITSIDRVKDFLSRLDDKRPDEKNILKMCRLIFACYLRHAVRHSADLETVLSMLYPSQQLAFAVKQNEYWFVYQKNCRMAFLSGRSPKSTETHQYFKNIDRHLVVRIFQEAGLLPENKNAPRLK